MTVTAQSVIQSVVLDTLQDPTSKKWPVDQLVRYLNDGQGVVATIRPDAFIDLHTMTLAAGSRQTLPDGYLKLIEPVGNHAGRSISVPAGGTRLMDAQMPGWRQSPQKSTILHVFYDERDLLHFDTWPPAEASTEIDLKLLKAPTPIEEPGADTDWTDVNGDLSVVDDLLALALKDYVLFRCYMKDAQHAAQSARASTHAQLFASALGVEVQVLLATGPQTDTAVKAPAQG